jgi:hypothetical protein
MSCIKHPIGVNRKGGIVEGVAEACGSQFHACTMILPEHLPGSATFSTMVVNIDAMYQLKIIRIATTVTVVDGVVLLWGHAVDEARGLPMGILYINCRSDDIMIAQ